MTIGKAITILAREKQISKYRISKISGIAQTTLSEITKDRKSVV